MSSPQHTDSGVRPMGEGREVLRRATEHLKRRLVRAMREGLEFVEPRFPIIGIVGGLGFPLYYLVWHFGLHQPYENLVLRMLGAALCLPLVFVRHWPARMRRWLALYWSLVLLYALPFFFTYMLFHNEFSTVWGMSMMVSILLLILVVPDWLLVMLLYVLGSLLACLAYCLDIGQFTVPQAYLEQLPVYAFALVAGNLCNHRHEQIKQEKLRGMMAVSRNIAHELRTPLQGVRGGVGGIRRYLPTLLRGYELARSHGLPVEPIRQVHLNSLYGVIERMEAEVDYSNVVVDMLLANTAGDRIRLPESKPCSVADCVRRALERYPFQPEGERGKVHFQCVSDFTFVGSDVLLMHVLFNLLRNSLYAIRAARKGEIYIRVHAEGSVGTIVFRDTGTGIHEQAVPYIFDQFFSSKATGQGTGLGLSFCKMVMHSFGGEIQCRSTLGEFTEFTLTLPVAAEAVVAEAEPVVT